MKKIVLIVCAALSVACVRRNASFLPGETVYTPRYAAGFTIHKAGERSTAIRIIDPWQGAEGLEQWVFVSWDGERAPENFNGTVLSSDPRRIICMSSSYVAFLGELGAADRIVGVSGAEFIADPLVSARWRAGDIADVGYDANLDFERIASLQPDLMLVYGVRSDDGLGAKLREMGVPYVYMGEYLESSPLGRAEWMVALGAMLNDAEGIDRFERIEQAYDNLRSQTVTSAVQPEVMLNAPYRDVWYVPGDDNYMVRLLRDAGGEYVCRGTAGQDSRPIDIEEAFEAMQRADFWLNTNHYESLAALLADNPRFAETPPVQTGRVFNNNGRMTAAGGSDFWESGVVRPDLVLRDLVQLLHPDVPLSETDEATSTLYYYKRLE